MDADSQLSKHQLFDRFHTRYATALYREIHLIVKDDTEVQDVLQDTLVKIWQHWEEYTANKGNLLNWARQIARRTALDHYRRHYVQRAIQPLDKANHLPTLDYPEFSHFDRLALATAIIHLLEPRHVEVIQLYYYKGYTQQEVADELGLPVTTIKNWIRQALQRLRIYLTN